MWVNSKLFSVWVLFSKQS
uniref:Uncharacterized protein n=1 Tax=Anguilla anguilla TaxID=7936 RepID=A0A0E9PTK8_ANGAN